MEVVIENTAEDLGERAAERIAQLVAGRPRPVLGVATGSSPLSTYAALARRVDAGLDLGGASVFALDEYLGLPADDPNSYRATIQRTVTGPLHLDPERVQVLDGSAADPQEACRRFEDAIRAAGGVDVQLLGIGGNGHIGFNEPGSPLDSRTRVQPLSEATRQANARFFDDPAQVPTHCLTQGLGTIMESRHVVLVAQGEQKAAAVAAALTGPVGPDCPASVLQRHPSVLVVLDPAAAGGLRQSAAMQ
ncbi:glucosamine-6-phosphate deaminase [Luteococcus peritonei]|uniref:Glucosamine-6-phosphate deaminase n=1 Tax=Luteococcus peritonei TaxID=88874 RepID=A0ABW4RXK5_9ACTN